MSSYNSMNKVYLLGKLGKNPELKYSQNNIAIANFSLATSENIKGQDGNYVEKTTWHNIVVFRKVAENCSKFLTKGSTVFIEGKLQNRSYSDKNGNEKYVTEVVAESVRFLDSKEKN